MTGLIKDRLQGVWSRCYRRVSGKERTQGGDEDREQGVDGVWEEVIEGGREECCGWRDQIRGYSNFL